MAESEILRRHPAMLSHPAVAAPILKWDMPYNDSIEIKPNFIFVPLIFEKQEVITDSIAIKHYDRLKIGRPRLAVDDEWLTQSMREQNHTRFIRYQAMIDQPQIVDYNVDMLPEPPKHYFIVADPAKNTLSLEERKIDVIVPVPETTSVRVRNWLHGFDGSIQFSQAYMSKNWYQGANNNLNILGNFVWNVSLNPNKYPKLLFDNTLQYKISLNSAPQDSLRSYSISEDLFQLNTKFGYKAYHNWYYSTTLQFKTQFFNNYTANTRNLTASFLTPGELNFGLGMSYSAKSKLGDAVFNLSLAPLSVNMKMCRENKRVNPATFGIDDGGHVNMQFGSNLEAKFYWRITTNITWTSRLFAFTNYDYTQGDWENTFNFSINKYLSTQLYAHLRYDDSTDIINFSWRHWQFKEILSFGLNYKFSM